MLDEEFYILFLKCKRLKYVKLKYIQEKKVFWITQTYRVDIIEVEKDKLVGWDNTVGK